MDTSIFLDESWLWCEAGEIPSTAIGDTNVAGPSGTQQSSEFNYHSIVRNEETDPVDHGNPTDTAAQTFSNLHNTPNLRKSYPTKDQWLAQRDTIGELYLEQNKPLKEVMEIMRSRYNFNASENVFKKNLKKLGLDKKNIKGQEALQAAILCKQRRDAVQKPSRIIIRGRKKDESSISRHLNRNPYLQAKLRSGNLVPSSFRSMDVIARTPSPDSAMMFSVPMVLKPVDDLSIAEELGKVLRDYVNSSFEAGVWTPDWNANRRYRRVQRNFNRWDNASQVAMEAITDGDLHMGFVLLNRWLSRVARILRNDHPYFLLYALNFIRSLGLIKDPDFRAGLSRSIVQHLRDMSQTVLGIGMKMRDPLTRSGQWGDVARPVEPRRF